MRTGVRSPLEIWDPSYIYYDASMSCHAYDEYLSVKIEVPELQSGKAEFLLER
jgi:hypothetical protein